MKNIESLPESFLEESVQSTHPQGLRFAGSLLVVDIMTHFPSQRVRDILVAQAAPLALIKARNSARTATDNRLAANPNETRLDLSHVVFRGE